jgi:hypothetical protein
VGRHNTIVDNESATPGTVSNPLRGYYFLQNRQRTVDSCPEPAVAQASQKSRADIKKTEKIARKAQKKTKATRKPPWYQFSSKNS